MDRNITEGAEPQATLETTDRGRLPTPEHPSRRTAAVCQRTRAAHLTHSMDRTLEDRTSLPQPDFQVQPRSPPYESNKPSTRLYSTSTGAFGVNGVSTGNDTSLASREFSRPPAHLIPAGNRIARRLVILPRSSDFFSTSYNYFSIFSTGKPRDRSTTSYLSA